VEILLDQQGGLRLAVVVRLLRVSAAVRERKRLQKQLALLQHLAEVNVRGCAPVLLGDESATECMECTLLALRVTGIHAALHDRSTHLIADVAAEILAQRIDHRPVAVCTNHDAVVQLHERDDAALVDIAAKRLVKLGHRLYATVGTETARLGHLLAVVDAAVAVPRIVDGAVDDLLELLGHDAIARRMSPSTAAVAAEQRVILCKNGVGAEARGAAIFVQCIGQLLARRRRCGSDHRRAGRCSDRGRGQRHDDGTRREKRERTEQAQRTKRESVSNCL